MRLACLILAVATSTLAQETQEFSLFAKSHQKSLQGRWVAEFNSTDSGLAVPIVLDSRRNTTRKIGGFLLQGSLLVDEPLRSGGSEYDGWIVGPIDHDTQLATPYVQPAGSSQGWYLMLETDSNDTVLGYKDATNAVADFFICNRQLAAQGPFSQQLLLGFQAKNAKDCKKVDLVVAFQ